MHFASVMDAIFWGKKPKNPETAIAKYSFFTLFLLIQIHNFTSKCLTFQKKNLLFAVTSVTSKEWCRPQATRAKRSRATLRSRPGSSHPSKVAVMPASERPSLPYLKISRQSQLKAYAVQQMIEDFLLGTYGKVLKV